MSEEVRGGRFAAPVVAWCVLAVVVGLAGAAAPAAAQTTQDLVGRWGVAAYWNGADAAKTAAAARAACSQPYVINRGQRGGAVMFEAFEGRAREFEVRGRQIVAFGDPNPRTTKDIVSWNGSQLVFRYAEEEAGRKYGNMVFVRCGAR